MKVSDNITYKEALHSNTAKRLGIENVPDKFTFETMQITAEHVFEPVRKHFNEPIYISSFYRCEELNKAIGGSSKSQHCKGEAIDIDDVYGVKSNAEMYNYIKENLNFDQLIWEFGSSKNPDWVHVSYVSQAENRNRCLIAYKENGKTKYKKAV